MKYSAKKIFNIRIGNIVYVKLGNNTISQARIVSIHTVIWKGSVGGKLYFKSNYMFECPNGYRGDDKDYKLYSDVVDIKKDIMILTSFDNSCKVISLSEYSGYYKCIRNIMENDGIVYNSNDCDLCLGNMYTKSNDNDDIYRVKISKMCYNHGYSDNEYEIEKICDEYGKSYKLCGTLDELRGNGFYRTMEEVRENQYETILRFGVGSSICIGDLIWIKRDGEIKEVRVRDIERYYNVKYIVEDVESCEEYEIYENDIYGSKVK